MTRKRIDDASAAIEKIGVVVMTSSRGDLRKLGEILSGFEELGVLAGKEGLADLKQAAGLGDAVVSALIFDDGARNLWDEGIDLVSRIATFCQETCGGRKKRTFGLSSLRNEAKSRLGVDLPEADGGQEAPAPSGDDSPGDSGSVLLDQEKDLYRDFVAESMEHLEGTEVKMTDFEADPKNPEILNAVFRAFHSIKGVSGFLNLTDINQLAHRSETILDLARKGELEVTSRVVDVVFEVIDTMKGMVADVSRRVSAGETERPLRDISMLSARIEGIQSGEGGDEKALEPDRAAPRPRVGDILLDQGTVTRQELATALERQKKMPPPPSPIGEILVEDGRVTRRDVVQALRAQKAGVPSMESQDIRVDVRKLDGLVDMVGELVIAQSLVRNDPSIEGIDCQRFFRNMSQLGRVTSELQRIAMALRMVPIRNTFHKMSRIVRDLGRKSGKEVAFFMEGDETEIDRNMVEVIHDPLVHVIRNSMDHGIEPADDRIAAGKPAGGTITLRAFHHGGSVVICIEDDGRGLDTGKILKKARERGLVPQDASLSEPEIFALIFEPGFSTADKVTDVSGRGVGMDVVRKNVEKLRGTIETRSQKGKGTTLFLRLPLTLAIIDGIVIRVGKERYVMPTNSISEAIRPAAGDYFTVAKRGEIIKVRGNLLPLVRLHDIFSVPEAEKDPARALVVIAEIEGQRRAILVDELLGKQEIVIKNLGDGVAGIRGVSGGAIMGDGKVGLILDMSGIFALTDSSAGCVA